ncbi:hypothetical protein SSP531S_22560 [Streptomyces spongiicola]|uniref:Uncharacterized protein n=1 Tax=Streptomyces spongiicola TaxID=1690221 RepID=A0A388SXS2_9ACTN|nr:hypothetical protein [Streptomyces spongiicola]GBQ00834.1 hypothetical protein SSP531S_22560 [Streptomyces spongiicola]
MQDQVEWPDVVFDPEAAESSEVGEVDRHGLQEDTSAAGLLDIRNEPIEIEGLWDRHGGHQALGLVPQKASSVPGSQLVESTVDDA